MKGKRSNDSLYNFYWHISVGGMIHGDPRETSKYETLFNINSSTF